MRQDVKELADAMEAGWKLAPEMCDLYFNDKFYPKSDEVISSCCAQGHALLGIGSRNVDDRSVYFPILYNQMVQKIDRDGKPYELMLCSAIDDLVIGYKWNTPRVVRWLRTHQND